jgi:anaerobic magnesium-protoporphyrin IX monomethyl ester cyclase
LDNDTIAVIASIPKDLVQFEIGVQSTNNETIKSIYRSTDFIKIKSYVMELIKQNNVNVHMDLIAGLPYEDFESFKKSFNDLYFIKPNCIQLGFLKVLKGSKIREESLKYGIEYESFAPYEVIKTNYISFEQINKLKTIDFLVDKYYNSGNFINTLNYIIKVYPNDPFDLFYDFSVYFEKKYSMSNKFSLDKIYDIIYDFVINELHFDESIFSEILKFDYVKRVKPTFYPKWFKTDLQKEKMLKKNEYKEFRNYTKQIETFYIDILKAVNSRFNIINKGKVNVLFEYKNNEISYFTFLNS